MSAGAPGPCPCGSGAPYDGCCGPLHAGRERAASAERLMRSRYSAFAVGDAAYLLRTWHAAARPRVLELDPDVVWTRLDVLAASGGGFLDAEGVVEFRASYRGPGGPGALRERSRFVKEGGAWLYAGALPPAG